MTEYTAGGKIAVVINQSSSQSVTYSTSEECYPKMWDPQKCRILEHFASINLSIQK